MAAYGKYVMNTVVDNFLVTKTSRLYNSNSSTPITDVESYEYTAPGSGLNYRLLKSVSKQNSGSSTAYYSKYTYAKEYTPAGSGDDMNNAINFFNTNNKNIVVESIQSFIDGTTEKITGANLNTFKPVTVGDIIIGGTTVPTFLPYKSYQFVNQAGIVSTSFAPSTISSGVFTWDNTNYVNTPTTIEQYNTRGIPQLITDNSRIPKTVLSTTVVNGVKVAEFTNAKPENIAFSDFDNAELFTGNFTFGGNAILAGGRYSGSYLNLQPNTGICRFLDKSPTSKNVIISFWLKDAASIGTIYLCTSKFACSGAACTANSIVSFTRGSQWKYYQVSVPWPHATYTTYSFTLGTSAAVKMDDVLIYPDNANVTTYSYTSNAVGTNLLTAKTGVNGIGNTYEYDNAGRLWLVRDQFDNIIEMKKYKLANRHVQQIASIGIGYPNLPVVNTSVTFYAAPPVSYETGDCDAPPIMYNWDFGDGSTGVSYGSGNIGSTTITHTYTTAAKYQVSVTASSPGMTNVFAQTPATNSTNPPPFEVVSAPPPCSPGTPQICASGITQLTSANQCITTSCSTTPALPNTCSDTYFKLIGITGGTLESVYSVEWEIADEGSSSWSTYWPEIPGTGGYIISRHFHITHTTSYQMRAKVKFCNSSGTVAYSNVILVKNGD